MTPTLSICIHTFNRGDLLDDTLGRLEDLERFEIPFEVVVSDNLSSDHTAEVIEKRRRAMPYLRHCLQGRAAPIYPAMINALRNARGRYVVYLADDDSLIPEALWDYVARMEREPDLTAIYADWIAYDDEQKRELHRYFQFRAPMAFGPENPVGLATFMLQYLVYPEVALFRRDALLQCDCHARRGLYPFYLWAYRLSRVGRVAFELTPYYREHRVLQRRFQRTSWANQAMRLQLIGDEFRNQLEMLVLLAIQDAGATHVAGQQALTVRQMIDRHLNSRLMLEVSRAVADKDWLLAVELRRRMVLWSGPGSQEDVRRDALEITFPAALQAIQETCRTLSGVSGVQLEGFRTRQVQDFFGLHYPDLALLESADAVSWEGSGRPLVVRKHGSPSVEAAASSGYELSLERLLDLYRINAASIDLTGL
jgi:glycosyltransferase involved in cell wall biosynthesis